MELLTLVNDIAMAKQHNSSIPNKYLVEKNFGINTENSRRKCSHTCSD
jgi:hypothetical protein